MPAALEPPPPHATIILGSARCWLRTCSEASLPLVLRAQVAPAVQPEQGGRGGDRDAVLPGAGLGDPPRLAHATGEQALADGVVDLVRPGVAEVLALEVNRRAPQVVGQASGEGEWRGPTTVGGEQIAKLPPERPVASRLLPRRGELLQGGHQRLRHEPAPVRPEVAPTVRERLQPPST